MPRFDFDRFRIWVQIALAAGFGLLAFFISGHYLEKERLALAAELTREEDQAAIIVAQHDLQSGSILSAQNLASIETDIRYLPEDTVLADQFGTIAGSALRRPLPMGKPLLWSAVEPPVTDRFADLVKPGQRALTIDVDSRMSIEGMLQVGDRLDLLIRKEDISPSHLEVLAENVPVIATGSRRLASLDSHSEVSEFGQNSHLYDSITLVIDVEMAARIILARATGALVLLLRGSGDEEPLPFRTVDGVGTGIQSIQFFGSAEVSGSQLRERRLTPVRARPADLEHAIQKRSQFSMKEPRR